MVVVIEDVVVEEVEVVVMVEVVGRDGRCCCDFKLLKHCFLTPT